MDDIDRIIGQWSQQRPDLDTRPMAVIGRLNRVARHLTQGMETTFARHGLSAAGFDVLATLLRSGAPYALTPNQLRETMMITSGTMTNRIDRLETAGLVKRSANRRDKRSIAVGLTRVGRETIDRAVSAHVATQTKLLAPLTPTERAQLDRLLRKFLAKIKPGDNP